MSDTGHPRVDRELRKAEVSRWLAAALLEVGAVKTVCAAAIGVRRQRLDEWADPDSPRSLSVADARALPPKVRRRLLERLASELGCTVVDLPSADERDLESDLELVTRVQRETSEAVGAHLAAIADGVIDRREAVRCRDEIDEAIGALLSARLLMIQALDRGVYRVERTREPTLRAVGADAE